LRDERQRDARILIVDDESANVTLLERLLKQSGYTNLVTTTESSQVVELCARMPPDLILLDLHMPSPDGFELLDQLEPWISGRWLPVLVLTADANRETKQRALANGAKDFLVKPLDAVEVLLRIRNLLETRFLHLESRKHNLTLEQRVHDQGIDLTDARIEMLVRLARAAEYRDDDTGQHTQRVGRTAELIARALDVEPDDAELIRHAATLHDVGKIGVPDAILLKPGRLTPDEFERMKAHVSIGAMILSGSRSPLLQVAEQVALTHHEWWDGSGYIAAMKGDEIPLAARIVAVADVFDALTTDRPYKGAVPLGAALDEIERLRGTQFDPDVVDAFGTLEHAELLEPVAVDLPALAEPNTLAANYN
jgi:putative two-component system response regulator